MSSTNPTTPECAPSPKDTRGAALDARNIKVTRSQNLRPIPEKGTAEERSQKVCTDHMVSALWTAEKGWAQPEIKPYGPLALMPTSNVLHYATECFEGMKLYRGLDGVLRLFRPYDNCLRMVQSAQRISLPAFDPSELLTMIQKLCSIDGPRWLPRERAGSFLYIRPTMIGTDDCLGFEVPKEALLYVIISYWPEPPKPSAGMGQRLYASRSDEVLWLYGHENQITEAGSSNVFVIWKSPEGKLQLVTAPLEENLILAGITRQSLLDLSRKRFSNTYEASVEGKGLQIVEQMQVVEEVITMGQLISAVQEDRLISAFIVGTAAFVSPISEINFRGEIIRIKTDGSAHVSLMRKWMSDIIYGTEAHEWAVAVDES
ncbi:hypothetical protein N7486_002450 [Penicillium sp. IBT 16267x]|nr:hypothetical protein N7486_002450 [Penicillium sp. IBT 16267x]